MGSIGHEQVSVAVIGAGIIGTHHASLIANCPDSHLAAVVDPTEAGSNLARTYNCDYFPSVEALLKSKCQVDGAIVCTPNATHVRISQLLSGQGLHLLIEKPLATSVEAGKDLLDVCQTNGTRICVGHHRRSHASVEAARNALTSGSIGKCIAVSGVWVALKTNSYFNGASSWHREPSGDIIWTNLIHEVDLLQYFLGPIRRVFAERSVSLRGYAGEEGLAMTLRFASGAVGTFIALDNSASPFNIEAGTGESVSYPFTGQDCYRFFGTRGTLTVPDGKVWKPQSLEKGRLSQWIESKLEWGDQEVYQRQLGNFVSVVRGSGEPVCSGADGLRAVAVCDAVRRSLTVGGPVDVESIE